MAPEGCRSGPCARTASQCDGRMKLEQIPGKQQPDNQWESGGCCAYKEQADTHIVKSLYKTGTCRYAYYGDKHVQPYIVQYPLRWFGNASESGMLAAQPAEEQSRYQRSATGAQADWYATDVDG